MADVEAVAILESAHHLAKVEDCFLFVELAVPVDEVEQIALFDKLGDKVASPYVSQLDHGDPGIGLVVLTYPACSPRCHAT